MAKSKVESEKFVYTPPAPNPEGCTCAWLVSLCDNWHQMDCPMHVVPASVVEGFSGLVECVTFIDGSCRTFVGGIDTVTGESFDSVCQSFAS